LFQIVPNIYFSQGSVTTRLMCCNL